MTISFFLWLAFPQPDPDLWPPKERNEGCEVYVTIDDYHSCINFPDYSMGGYQEWHMGAKNWYMDFEPNVWDVVANSFVEKTSAVIKFGVFFRPYWERMNISAEKVFHFWLSQKGFSRMQAALHKYRGQKMEHIGDFWYFPYLRGYYLFKNCNSFTASVLSAAGLPVREVLAQEGITMTWQLNRCASIQKKHYGSEVLTSGSLKEKNPRQGVEP